MRESHTDGGAQPEARNDDEHLLDLLVDGELDEPRRRQLLTQLDEHPEKWRRCALAFIESQAWRQATRVARQQAEPAARPEPAGRATAVRPAPALPPPRNTRWPRAASHPAWSVAASFLLAFGLGMWIRGGWPVDGGGHGPSPVQLAAPAAREADNAWLPATRNVGLLLDDPAGRGTRIELPMIDARGGEAELLDRWPMLLGHETRQALERQGHRVEQRRQWLPFELDDGRRGVVPVDQLDVQPAQWRPYQ